MDTDLMEWLNMVWSALDEQDSSKRIHLLENANCFLEQLRELPQEEPDASPVCLAVPREPVLHAS